jgi:hypothetical protein
MQLYVHMYLLHLCNIIKMHRVALLAPATRSRQSHSLASDT